MNPSTTLRGIRYLLPTLKTPGLLITRTRTNSCEHARVEAITGMVVTSLSPLSKILDSKVRLIASACSCRAVGSGGGTGADSSRCQRFLSFLRIGYFWPAAKTCTTGQKFMCYLASLLLLPSDWL